MPHPKIYLPITNVERLLDRLTFALFLLLVSMTAYYYTILPDEIPIHFNLKGEVDNTSSKAFIWLLPTIGGLTCYFLYYISRFPHTYNYPFKITEENASKEYLRARKFMRMISLSVMLVFFLAQLFIIYNAIHPPTKANQLLLPLILIITFAPIIGYFFMGRK